MSKNDGGPAFPDVRYANMTVRDVFAAHALAGLLASNMDPSVAITTAWLTADAMLAAREN
jgi:hypothetical protein